MQTRDGVVSTTLVHPSRPYFDIAAAPRTLRRRRRIPRARHRTYPARLRPPVVRFGAHPHRARTCGYWSRQSPPSRWHTRSRLRLATLGFVHVPVPPVEAAIALSILLLACEIMRSSSGQPSFTARWPWLVAFSFGLLHGFGFASALAEIGLPQRRHSARAVHVQCRCRARAARVHRRCTHRAAPRTSNSGSRRGVAPGEAHRDLCDWHPGGILVYRSRRSFRAVTADGRDT